MERNIAELEIKTIPLDQLQGWDKNPREITDDNFRRLKRDLVKYAMLTPLIACEQTGRKCRLVELDEHYCDVIVDRYKTFKETDLGISVIRDGKKLTLEEARNGKTK